MVRAFATLSVELGSIPLLSDTEDIKNDIYICPPALALSPKKKDIGKKKPASCLGNTFNEMLPTLCSIHVWGLSSRPGVVAWSDKRPARLV